MRERFQEYVIRSVKGLVTQVDENDLNAIYALRMRGLLMEKEGMIIQRDWGTIVRHSSYPNGYTIVSGTVLYDHSTNTEHDIIFTVDNGGHSAFFIRDGDTWIFPTVRPGSFEEQNGTTPHVRWLAHDALRKVNVYYGTSDNPPVMRRPVEIKKQTQRNYFYASGGALETLASGWYVDRGGGGLIPTFKSSGSLAEDANPSFTNGQGAVGPYTNGVVLFDHLVADQAGAFAPVNVGDIIRVLSSPTGIPDQDTEVIEKIDNENVKVYPSIDFGPPFGDPEDPQYTHYDWQYYSKGGGLGMVVKEIEDPPLGAFVRFGIDVMNQTTTDQEKYYARYYVTALYDGGTQESDPIYMLNVAGSSKGTFPKTTWRIGINYSNMCARLSGLMIYANVSDSKEHATLAEWIDAPKDYKPVYTVYFDRPDENGKYWHSNGSAPFIYQIELDPFTKEFITTKRANATQNLDQRLNHAIQTTGRTYLKPRYAVRISTSQGGTICVDQDDRTLRLSSYNGDRVHEEDNFPNAVVDNHNVALKIPLLGRGSLVGLQSMDDILYVFRGSEIEAYDLQGNQRAAYDEGCIAPLSIVQCKYGICFAGASGIRLIPRYGGPIRTLNQEWQNLYSGSLMIDDGTKPYVTHAFRTAIVGGYHEQYESLWYVMQMERDSSDGGGSEYICAVCSLATREHRWRFRKLNVGIGTTVQTGQLRPLVFLSRRDGTLDIVFSTGILRYPHRTGDHTFEDAVAYNGSSTNKGIETGILLNIGDLSSTLPKANITGTKIRYKGKSKSRAGFALLRWYANNSTRPFEEKYIRVDDPPVFREFERAGPLQNLKLHLSIPHEYLTDVQDFEVSEIVIGYTINQDYGNR